MNTVFLTTSPSDGPHQFNYFEQDDPIDVMHNARIAKASAWEESAR